MNSYSSCSSEALTYYSSCSYPGIFLYSPTSPPVVLSRNTMYPMQSMALIALYAPINESRYVVRVVKLPNDL